MTLIFLKVGEEEDDDKEDKEVIAEEGEGLIENEKTDDPDKTGLGRCTQDD